MAPTLEQLPRYGKLAWLLWKHGGSHLIADDLPGIGSGNGHDPDEAKSFASDLEDLGPTYVKLGQLLSTRSDLLPEETVGALSRLQDDVEPIAIETVREVFAAEIGVDVDKAFATFDETPLASASLAQVHAATLRDGRRVAVKVQRPGVRESVARDMAILSDVAGMLDQRWDSIDLPALVADLDRTLSRELDYRQEIEHLSRLRRLLADHPQLVVPRPIADFSSSRVLTMDLVSGRKITDLHPVALIDVDGERLATELFNAYLDNILVDGFFHADPHPGNILLTDDHRLAFIDLGMVAELGSEFRERLLQLLLAVSEGNGSDTVRAALRLGTPTDQFDEQRLRMEVEALVQRVSHQTIGRMRMGEIVIDIERVARASGFRMPREFALLGKTMLNLDQIAARLSPGFDPNAAVRSRAAEIAQEQLRESWSPSAWISRAVELRDFLDGLPRRLTRLIESASRDGFKINVEALDEDLLIGGFQKVANRITAGLILAAMIVGAALIMRIPTPLTLFGYPMLAIVLFGGATLGGLALLWSIWRSDR